MKKLRRQINKHGIFVASLLLTSAILLPLVSAINRPMSIQEYLLLDLSQNVASLMVLRLALFGLVILNMTLVYGLVSAWFAKRRAGLTTFILACIPVWLIAQIALPRFTLILAPTLMALWAFERAGRSSTRAALWYGLSGLATTAAWLQEPVGVTLVMLLCALLLIGVKPRYVKHIGRQSSLVIIILIVTVAAISTASWKFNLGIQEYLVRQLSVSIQVANIPMILAEGPSTYHVGVSGISLIPLSVAVLAGLGAWQLFITRKRARNVYILALPVLFGLASVPFGGLTTVLLLSVAIIGVAIWTVMGVQYLHVSWKRVFPHNRLANTVGDLLIVMMLTSLALYSFWYVNKAWNGNPQTRTDASIEWKGKL
jgi:MFS family permease